ncbi:hypothetical protein TNCV_2025941 [Trichonephila clavipes]|nr:hypothetical protein TNCV_2025941 [Trichonephila clavipes]
MTCMTSAHIHEVTYQLPLQSLVHFAQAVHESVCETMKKFTESHSHFNYALELDCLLEHQPVSHQLPKINRFALKYMYMQLLIIILGSSFFMRYRELSHTYFDRIELEYCSQTGFFVTVVVVQMFTLMGHKTSRESLWAHGLRSDELRFQLRRSNSRVREWSRHNEAIDQSCLQVPVTWW